VPSVFGHEMAGTVEKAGPGVEGFAPGDRVVPANSAPCGECWCCESGMPNLCEDMLYINGAFAEYALIPGRIVKKNLLRIPEGMPFRHAAMTEPLACAMHGADVANAAAGDTALLCGAGPLGLMFVAVLEEAGARVIVAEPVEGRRKIASALGADETFEPSDEAGISDITTGLTEGGRGVDVAIDATGIPAVWEQCVLALRKGGTAVLFGGARPGTSAAFDTRKIHYDQLTIKGIYHHTPEYVRRSLAFLSSRGDDLGAMITTTLPLQDTEKALRMMADRKALKVEIDTCRPGS
jgi:L-iditol 2-dehydrogenase